MKKKFGLFALVLAVLLCGSLFLLAACDETEEDPADTPATISVTVNGTAQTSGGTYSATVGTAYTFAATASNGNAVTISYVFGDAEAEELEGTSFTPETAGSYAFTFTAEDATNFTLTLVAAEAETPPAPQYTVTYELGGQAAADAQAPTEQTVAENTQITLAAAVEAAEGYTFGGWNDGTTTYEAGATYTVTDNVTMTAVWNVVHTHTYTWKVTQVPTDSARGSATGTCSGCEEGTDGYTTTIDLPVLTEADAYTTNVKTHATCTVAEVTTYTYAENTQITFDVTGSVDLSVAGHGTSNLTFTAAKAATCVDDACGAYVYCSVCQKYYAVTAGTSLDDPDLAISTDAQDSASAFIDEDTATGHSYGVSYESRTVTAACSNSGCDSSYTATVTISGGEDATGNTVFAAENFAFNAETQQFTVTLPENGYTYDGHTFSGWLVGGETYTEGQVTVAAGEELSITAGWTQIATPTIDLEVSVESTDDTVTIPTSNGGSIGGAESNAPVCVGTTISYEVTVLNAEGATPSISYALDNNQSVALTETSGEFKFEAAGTYVFTITAEGSGAADYEFTVIVTEHDYANGSKDVTTVPTATATGTLTITCKSCYPSAEGHSFEVELPTLTDMNVTSMAGGYRDTIYVATCEEAGSRQYTFIIPEQYGGGEIHVATVTLEQLEHSYGAETVDEATGNIIQTCTSCGTATNTLATLTGLSVGWAESAQGWYTVGGTIDASDFDVTYTYDVNVDAYAGIITEAITNDITHESTAQTGLVTVTFTLGDTDASIDVMVYAANEANGAKVLQNKMGTAVSALGTAYDVAAIPDAVTNGFAVSFWKTGDADSDWSTIVISGKGADGANGFDITLPNLDPFDYGGDWAVNAFPEAADFRNGGTYDDFILGPAFITVSVNADGSIAYYLNGVLKIMYQSTKAVGAGGKTVGDFVLTLLNGVQSYGFALGSAVANSGVVGDDLFVTSALTDAQAAAMFKAYQMPQMNTEALMSGIEKDVFASSYAASVYKAEAISGVAKSGLSISFNLIGVNHGTNPQATDWDDIILGTNVELDVCLGVLDAWANTSVSMEGNFNCYTPSHGNASYFRTGTVSGYVTVTLTTEGSIVVYHNGERQIEYGSTSAVGAHTVATMVNAIFAEIAANSFDVCEGVDASELLLTAALDATQAKQLYENWQGLHA